MNDTNPGAKYSQPPADKSSKKGSPQQNSAEYEG